MITTPFYLWAGNMWLLGLVVWMTLYGIVMVVFTLLLLMSQLGLTVVIARAFTLVDHFWRSREDVDKR